MSDEITERIVRSRESIFAAVNNMLLDIVIRDANRLSKKRNEEEVNRDNLVAFVNRHLILLAKDSSGLRIVKEKYEDGILTLADQQGKGEVYRKFGERMFGVLLNGIIFTGDSPEFRFFVAMIEWERRVDFAREILSQPAIPTFDGAGASAEKDFITYVNHTILETFTNNPQGFVDEANRTLRLIWDARQKEAYIRVAQSAIERLRSVTLMTAPSPARPSSSGDELKLENADELTARIRQVLEERGIEALTEMLSEPGFATPEVAGIVVQLIMENPTLAHGTGYRKDSFRVIPISSTSITVAYDPYYNLLFDFRPVFFQNSGDYFTNQT